MKASRDNPRNKGIAAAITYLGIEKAKAALEKPIPVLGSTPYSTLHQILSIKPR
jgi:hypothetical protein